MPDATLEMLETAPVEAETPAIPDDAKDGAVHDYRNSEKWAIFAESYFENKGKIGPAAREAELSEQYCRRLYRTSEDFRGWLKEMADLRFAPVRIAIDNRIIEAITENQPITPDENRSFRLALDRLGVIDKTLVGINVGVNGGGAPIDLSNEQRADLVIWVKKNPAFLNG
jgi:hypothetical protein